MERFSSLIDWREVLTYGHTGENFFTGKGSVKPLSSPRYNWWPFVINMIRDYPKRKLDYDDLHDQKVTASATGAPGGGAASRKTEDTALRQLPAQEQREYDAVHKAELRTLLMPDGETRVKVIRLTLWRNQFTVPGVANWLHISESRAKSYRWEFIMLTAYCYGLISQEDYLAEIKKRSYRTPKAKKL